MTSFGKMVLPLVRRPFPPLFASNLVSVQPLYQPSGPMSFHSRVQFEAYLLWEKAGKPEEHSDKYWDQAILKLVPSVQWAIQEEIHSLTCSPSDSAVWDYEFKYGDYIVAMSKLGSSRSPTVYTLDVLTEVRQFDLSSIEEYDKLIALLRQLYAERVNYELEQQRIYNTSQIGLSTWT